MNLFSWTSWMRQHARILLEAVGAEIASALLTVLAAWECANILNRLFLSSFHSIKETAPDFLVLFLALVIKALSNQYRQKKCLLLAKNMLYACRQHLHRHILCQPIKQAGTLPVLAIETIDALAPMLTHVLPELLSLLIVLPVVLLAAVMTDGLSALLFLATLPIAPFLLYLTGQVTQNASRREWHHLEELSAGFRILLSGMPVLKRFRQVQAQRLQLKQFSEAFAHSSLQVLRLAFLSSFVLELITTLSIAIIAVSIGLRLLAGRIDFQHAFFILLLAPEFYQPLRQIAAAFHSVMTAVTAKKRLQQEEIFQPAELQSPLPAEFRQKAAPASISIRSLSWHYPSAQTDLFQGLSAEIPAGKITVITGPSGTGKTTLLKLIAGLFPTCSTMICRTGGTGVSYVPQAPHLFAASLADNLTLFHSAPKEALWHALRMASLDSWAKSLPNGMNTQLGDGGQTISRGQRQRLGLARSFLQDQPLLLLDEPTAGLDMETEQQVLQSLCAFHRGRTIVIATHRPAVIALSDHQIHLEPPEDLPYDHHH